MRAKNRLSPYPILNDYGDDYTESSFSAEIQAVTQFTEVYGKINFQLNNSDIQALIDAKKAKFVAHVECPTTCFRAVIETFENEEEFKVSADQISNKIEIRTFIILEEDIKGFTSQAFHPDYQGMAFDLSRHQVLAVGSAIDFDVKKDDRDMESLPSILRIVKLKDKKKGTLSVDTDNSDHITIGLSEDVFELYVRLGKSTFKATAFSLILLPALVVILQRMSLMCTDESYTSMHWYQVIESLLEKNNLPVESIDIQNDSLLSICQSIFADPISRSLKELEAYSERMCD